MLTDYSNTRLAGLRVLFPKIAGLRSIASVADGKNMARILSGTLFSTDIDSLTLRRGAKPTAARILRAINEGSLRIKERFAVHAFKANPAKGELFVIRWEIEEIKAALRYLTFGGAGMEKRFTYISYLFNVYTKKLWNPHMKPEEFQAALRRAGHPLFKMLSKTSHIADHAERELAMERYFFTEYLPSRTKNLCPACAEYFRDQLDMINAKNAWLSHGGQAEQRGRETEYYIKAGGKVSDSDFADIARAPNVLAAARIIEERMRQRLNPEKLDSPYGLSTAIKHALLKKYNRYRIARPLSVWSYFYFAEELDAMIADVKNAVYCGVTCSTIDVVQRRFIGPGS